MTPPHTSPVLTMAGPQPCPEPFEAPLAECGRQVSAFADAR